MTNPALPPELARFGLVSTMRHRAYPFPDECEFRSGGRRVYGVVIRELSVEDGWRALAGIKAPPAGMSLYEFNSRQQAEDLRASLVCWAHEPLSYRPVYGIDEEGNRKVVSEEPAWDQVRWTRIQQPCQEVETWSQAFYVAMTELHALVNGVPTGVVGKMKAAGVDWSESGTAPSPIGSAGGSTGGRSTPMTG
jgi:hypothetical protein